MNRSICVSLAVLLIRCTEDQGATVVPAAADANLTLAAKTTSVAKAAPEPEPESELEPEPEDEPETVVGACAVKIPWSSIPRCKHDGFVYAAAAIDGVREVALARSGAAERARKVLFGNRHGVLEASEVLEAARCGRSLFALARAPEKNVAPETTPCNAAKLEGHGPVLPGCPAWTSIVVKSEGETLLAVGVARLKNRALAESTAINRARAELSRAARSHVAPGQEHAEESGFSEIGRKKVICAGNTFVELTAKSIE